MCGRGSKRVIWETRGKADLRTRGDRKHLEKYYRRGKKKETRRYRRQKKGIFLQKNGSGKGGVGVGRLERNVRWGVCVMEKGGVKEEGGKKGTGFGPGGVLFFKRK